MMNIRHPFINYVLGIALGMAFGSFVTSEVFAKRLRESNQRLEQIKRQIEINAEIQKKAEICRAILSPGEYVDCQNGLIIYSAPMSHQIIASDLACVWEPHVEAKQ